MRPYLAVAALAVTFAMPAIADAAINPLYGIGWDTRSANDYGLLQRGLTLNNHTAELAARFTYIDIDDAENYSGLDLNFSFGFGNLEAGIETIFELSPDGGWSQQIIPRVLFDLYSSRTVDIALTGFLVLDFDDANDETLPLLQFGAPFRIKFGDGLALFLGHNAITWGRVPDDYVNLDINIGLSKQLSNDLALRFDTQLASLNIAGDAGSTSYGDVIPLGVGLIYAVANHFDLSASLIYQAIDNAPNQLALNGGLYVRF
jgi:hypothetical protein